MRGEPWVPAFARGRAASLRLLAVGREPDFAAVVGSYCRFLEALEKRKRRWVLDRLLRDAERRLDALAERVKRAG
jgi:hypothetical protein